ncbi:hypothetical protein PHMEG_00029452 [Phytophthora megakarya]|uniref:Eukaryotic/viral aspartic protease n=1 Tax=Phytophthora megakarya TaxID=4795 RepID=A0A225V2N1_9STRA|nr:hypothetical protein PHMEG_00029452 [Phytophthora megakarya]
MAKGDKSAVPATPMKSGGTRSEASGRARSSYSTPTTSQLEEVAGPAMDSDDDGSDGVKPSAATGRATSQSTGFRPPINRDTPGANKKLRAAFGEEEIALGRQVVARQALMPADPSQVPLPQTPVKQNESSMGVFGSKGSPYMHDSHMVPPRSASRQDRVVKENEASRPTPNTYKGPTQQPDHVDNLEGDLTEEWAQQIRELSAKEEKNSKPRIEITTHLPLGHIKAFSGYRNKSEKSMQWLRTFIYEMKGTHTPPNDWCMAFELSLQDGALHWYRQLPRKTRRTDESPYRPRITLAEALSDLVTALNETSVGSQTRQQASYDQEYESNEDSFGDGERREDEDRYSNRGSEYDYAGEDERGHVAAANDHERRAAAEGTFARSDNRRSKGDGHFNNDRGFARDNRNGRQQYGPCAACGGLTHSVHYCYKRCKMCKQVKWPEDREMGFVNTTEIVEENDGSLGGNEVREVDAGEYDGYLTEVSASSWGPNEAQPRSLVRTAKLLPGERLGWWSSQRYDKRKRVRAVVMGAIDDTRTRILLDTVANVSVISAAYAKRLRLREVSDHGRSLEVRGINPGVLETRRRALVKITLGWERVYEFEIAGVDVVLGTDLMISAGVRLDLFHGAARLPDGTAGEIGEHRG